MTSLKETTKKTLLKKKKLDGSATEQREESKNKKNDKKKKSKKPDLSPYADVAETLERRGDPSMDDLLTGLVQHAAETNNSACPAEKAKRLQLKKKREREREEVDAEADDRTHTQRSHLVACVDWSGKSSDATVSSNTRQKKSSSSSTAPIVSIPTADASTTFASMGLIAPLLAAVTDLGYANPSPIQQQAIPVALKGLDLLAGAQTGTGKTAAFSLPILQLLVQEFEEKKQQKNGKNPIRVLMLTPTRELAAQIHENINGLTAHLRKGGEGYSQLCATTTIVGGVNPLPQIQEIKGKQPTILVATPGRLLDLCGKGKDTRMMNISKKYADSTTTGAVIDLPSVSFLVLDEADRMLDMGFYPDVSKVLALLPKQKQSFLFSATFSNEIRKLASTILRPNAKAEVQVTPPNSTVDRIQQGHYLVARDKKDEALRFVIESNNWFQVLVFTRTKGGANEVAFMLNQHGMTALALHGGKSQNARTSALSDFKSGKLRVLVATDIAARGIDINDLPHVINYELPNVCEDYVHRIGRTGRAGKEGFAVSLVCVDEEGFLANIERFASSGSKGSASKGGPIIPLRTDLPPHLLPPPSEKAMPIAMGKMTLWGGKGPMPSREVMEAAGRAKRKEIAAAIRDRNVRDQASRGQRGGGGGGRGGFSHRGGAGRGGGHAFKGNNGASNFHKGARREVHGNNAKIQGGGRGDGFSRGGRGGNGRGGGHFRGRS